MIISPTPNEVVELLVVWAKTSETSIDAYVCGIENLLMALLRIQLVWIAKLIGTIGLEFDALLGLATAMRRTGVVNMDFR